MLWCYASTFLPLTSQIPKNHKNSTESSMNPSFFWAFSSAWCSCLLVISVEMQIYDLSWYEGHAVDFPMLRLHPGLGSHILSDKNKKYGTAADSVLCAEWVEESFGKKLPSATKKKIPCLYSHAVHRYAIFWENIHIDTKSLFSINCTQSSRIQHMKDPGTCKLISTAINSWSAHILLPGLAKSNMQRSSFTWNMME